MLFRSDRQRGEGPADGVRVDVAGLVEALALDDDHRAGVEPRGVASLAVDFGASVLRTDGSEDTADLLEVIARREQEADDRSVSVHGEKGGKTLAERQEYVVGAIAEVGPVTARSLLEHFGSVEAVMTAGEDALLGVEGVGEVTAGRIREVAGGDYADAE